MFIITNRQPANRLSDKNSANKKRKIFHIAILETVETIYYSLNFYIVLRFLSLLCINCLSFADHSSLLHICKYNTVCGCFKFCAQVFSELRRRLLLLLFDSGTNKPTLWNPIIPCYRFRFTRYVHASLHQNSTSDKLETILSEFVYFFRLDKCISCTQKFVLVF